MARRILLLGTSLALETVGAALAAVPDVDLRRYAALNTRNGTWPEKLPPDAVIFDLTSGLPAGTLARLERSEPLLLLGLDLEGQRRVLDNPPSRGAVRCLIGVSTEDGPFSARSESAAAVNAGRPGVASNARRAKAKRLGG